MRILIMGGAGMIGQKLLNLLLQKKELKNQKISEITLFDIVEAPYNENSSITITTKSGDISDPQVSRDLISSEPDVIFHLAAIVSGQAEQEFDLGWNINTKGSWGLFEAIRSQRNDYVPRVVFTSSIAVFGSPFPDQIPDDFLQLHLPLTELRKQFQNFC